MTSVRVAGAGFVGTMLEAFDLFLYASAASVVFERNFFTGVGDLRILASLATIGFGFVFRPLGASLGGHFGDRFGRRQVLVVSLVGMGLVSAAVGCLPTYAQVGSLAPLGLLACRALQGVFSGAEWGGAATLTTEHAENGIRGFLSSSVPAGVPAGLILSSGLMLLVRGGVGDDAFLAWGWRIPFLVSLLLVGIGLWIRLTMDESPMFLHEVSGRGPVSSSPLRDSIRLDRRGILVSGLAYMAGNAFGYFLISFVLVFASIARISPSDALSAVMVGAAAWLIFTPIGGVISDRFSGAAAYVLGYAGLGLWVWPFFELFRGEGAWLRFVATGILGVFLGISSGAQALVFYSVFRTARRVSATSLAFTVGGVLGGGLTPLLATYLMGNVGLWSVQVYMVVVAAIGLFFTFALKTVASSTSTSRH